MAEPKPKANPRKPPTGIPRGLGKPAVYYDLARLDDPERGPDFFEELALAARTDKTVYDRFLELAEAPTFTGAPRKNSGRLPSRDVTFLLVRKGLDLDDALWELRGGLRRWLVEVLRQPLEDLNGEQAAQLQAAVAARLNDLEAEEKVKRLRLALTLKPTFFPLTPEEEQCFRDLRWLDFAFAGARGRGSWDSWDHALDAFYAAHERTHTPPSARINKAVNDVRRRERARVTKEANQYWKELGRLPELNPDGQNQLISEMRRAVREIREGRRGPGDTGGKKGHERRARTAPKRRPPGRHGGRRLAKGGAAIRKMTGPSAAPAAEALAQLLHERRFGQAAEALIRWAG